MMTPILIKAAWQGQSDCLSCGVRQSVLFADLNEEDFSRFHTPIDDFEYTAGSHLHEQGAPAAHVYTIRSGMVKLSVMSPDGEERVLRVLKAGALAGLDAIVSGRYGQTAVALGPVKACRIPIELIKTLSTESPRLHGKLMEKWGEALQEAEAWFAELNSGQSDQRVARFVLRMLDPEPDQYGRIYAQLFKREDMGAMLGLTLETVSRKVSALKKAGIISSTAGLQGRVEVLDVPALRVMAES